jgi:hypothetical protein
VWLKVANEWIRLAEAHRRNKAPAECEAFRLELDPHQMDCVLIIPLGRPRTKGAAFGSLDFCNALSHWMMIGGGVLVLVGFIGFALKRNAEPKDPEIIAAAPIEDSHE